MGSICPEMDRPCGPVRNSTSAAMSAGSSSLFIDWLASASASSSSMVRPDSSARPAITLWKRGPSTAPGWMELAVMPYWPSSSAKVFREAYESPFGGGVRGPVGVAEPTGE